MKGSGISFAEDLCKELQEIMDDLRGHPKIASIWAWNGKVIAKDRFDKVRTLWYGTNWVKFFDNLNPPATTPPPSATMSGGQATNLNNTTTATSATAPTSISTSNTPQSPGIAHPTASTLTTAATASGAHNSSSTSASNVVMPTPTIGPAPLTSMAPSHAPINLPQSSIPL